MLVNTATDAVAGSSPLWPRAAQARVLQSLQRGLASSTSSRQVRNPSARRTSPRVSTSTRPMRRACSTRSSKRVTPNEGRRPGATSSAARFRRTDGRVAGELDRAARARHMSLLAGAGRHLGRVRPHGGAASATRSGTSTRYPRRSALRVDHPVGALAPLHCTALGKAFLAFGQCAPPKDLTRHTERTIVDPDRSTRKSLRRAGNGFANDDEEFSPGVRCVAAPILDDGGHNGRGHRSFGADSAHRRLRDLSDLGRLVRDRCSGLARKTQRRERFQRA